MLIAALSGRALAEAAHRAGYAPLVADLFDDLDTGAVAECRRVAGNAGRGFRAALLLDALEHLRAGRNPVGLVYGSGFEDRPRLLRALGERHRLLGNRAEVVARINDPVALASLCAELAIPHPGAHPAADAHGQWLRKRRGASGGAHIRPVPPSAKAERGHYLQPLVEGVPISALFVADGCDARLLGLSRQWTDPAPTRPYRYGGAVRPASVRADRMREIARIVGRLVPAAGLVGLNSADFLVRSDDLDLIEINPRPGATIDLFADPDGRLFQLHLDACAGRLPHAAPRFPEARAAAFVYAPRRLQVAVGMRWPEWTADRQRPGVVRAGAPLCTVLADAADADAAERLVRARAASILSMTEGAA